MTGQTRKRLQLLGKILFVAYVGFLLYFLIFSDWYGRTGEMKDYQYNIILFKEIRRFINYRKELGAFVVLTNLVGNIFIFVPFGFFTAMASKYRTFIKTVGLSFVLSLGVEVFQLFTKVGSFDVDDLLLNVIGGALGYIVFSICNKSRRNRNAKRKRKKK